MGKSSKSVLNPLNVIVRCMQEGVCVTALEVLRKRGLMAKNFSTFLLGVLEQQRIPCISGKRQA